VRSRPMPPQIQARRCPKIEEKGRNQSGRRETEAIPLATEVGVFRYRAGGEDLIVSWYCPVAVFDRILRR
jgi:hypothetical protein